MDHFISFKNTIQNGERQVKLLTILHKKATNLLYCNPFTKQLSKMKYTNITFKYFVAAVLAVLGTWFLHEFAHWATSEFLGYETNMKFTAYPSGGSNITAWHRILISASGPIITILQATVIFIYLKKAWNKHLYLLLLIPLCMRILAGIFNLFKPNDEGRISEYYNLGLYTIPILVNGFLFYMVYKTSRKHHLRKKFNVSITLIVTVLTFILTITDQISKIRIL
mgnify:CR=1 FL=1